MVYQGNRQQRVHIAAVIRGCGRSGTSYVCYRVTVGQAYLIHVLYDALINRYRRRMMRKRLMMRLAEAAAVGHNKTRPVAGQRWRCEISRLHASVLLLSVVDSSGRQRRGGTLLSR